MNNISTVLEAGMHVAQTTAIRGNCFLRHYRFMYNKFLVFFVLFTSLSATGRVAQAQDGRFPIIFKNLSGKYSDDQIFIYGLALNQANQWCYVTATGDMVPMNPADISGPGHLTKGGMNFANYAFRLSQASNFRMASHVRGGRFYISVGEPMYIRVAPEGVGIGWGGPNLNDPHDPNADVIWDLYELTYAYRQIPYGGNVSSVDQFGFTMTARLEQVEINYDQTVGTTLSREEAFNSYLNNVPAAFKALANNYRIVAPRSSAMFKTGGISANYFQSYIDQVWSYYTANPFKLTRLNQTFTGQISGTNLVFTGPTGSGVLRKPTSADVCECAGALASDGMNDAELQMGAEFCAAFNRGVAMTTNLWWGSNADYYKTDFQNEYSKFLHSISMNNRSYAFSYDDINDQSSVRILPNADPPTRLTITIQKFGGTTSTNSVLSGIEVTPANTVVNTGQAVQFTARGFDQSGRTMTITPTWTGTNSTGLFTATTSGVFTVSATAISSSGASISGSAQITVNSSGGSSVCSGTVANGDYRYEVSTTSDGVNWQFIPLAPIAGSTLAIITIKTSTSGYIGYTMTAAGSNFTFTRAYPSGTVLSFYFTYRVGNTTMERNSSATPHNYSVGTSCNTAGRLQDRLTVSGEDMESKKTLFPNPVHDVLHVPDLNRKKTEVTIQDVMGKTYRSVKSISEDSFDVSALPPGYYLLFYMKDKQKVMTRFYKE